MNPNTYSALVCESLSDDLSGLAVRQLERPLPGPGQVLVNVRAAALNFFDLLMTQGRYQFKPELPFVPGIEAAGEVAAVGAGVAHLKAGDGVLVHARIGAVAACMLADGTDARPIPHGLDFAQAAAFQAAANTAYVALVRRAGLKAGETLLVHGASGGVGLAAVQLGRHLGATVIATGRSDEKLAIVREHGAHHTINLARDLREEVMKLTGGGGVDVVLDPVGGDVFDASLRCLGWGGRLLVVGFVAGRIPEVKANYILIKNISIIGVRAGEEGRRDPLAGREIQRAIDSLASEGVFRPHICARLPLERAVDGLRMFAEGNVTGKIVIEP